MKKIIVTVDVDDNPELQEIEVGYDADGNPYTERVIRRRKPTPQEILMYHTGHGRMIKF